MGKYKLFKVKQETNSLEKKKKYSLSKFGINTIYSKIHVIVETDGKENVNGVKIMEDHKQYISDLKTLSYRSKNINNPQAEKEKKIK